MSSLLIAVISTLVLAVEGGLDFSLVAEISESSAAKIALSPDGKKLVIGTDEGIRVWDLPSLKADGPYQAHYYLGIYDNNGVPQCGVNSIRFLKNGERFITAGADGNICVWDLAKRKCILTISEPWAQGDGRDLHTIERVPVKGIALDEAGKRVFGATRNFVTVWNFETGKRLSEYGAREEHGLLSMAELANRTVPKCDPKAVRRFLALEREDGGAQPQNLNHWKRLADGEINTVEFASGLDLVTTGRAHKTEVWNAQTGKSVKEFDRAGAAAVSSRRDSLAIGGFRHRCSLRRISDWREMPLQCSGTPYAFLNNDEYLLVGWAGNVECHSLTQSSKIELPGQPIGARLVDCSVARESKVLAVAWRRESTRGNIKVYKWTK